MADMVEKHKKAMAMHTVKVLHMDGGTPVVLKDDYITLATKYDQLRELHGELTGKFFKSAERLALEMGRRQALLTRYEKAIRETQDAREIAFGYMQSVDFADAANQDLQDENTSLKELVSQLVTQADEIAQRLRAELAGMDHKPQCLSKYDALSKEIKEICDVHSDEAEKD